MPRSRTLKFFVVHRRVFPLLITIGVTFILVANVLMTLNIYNHQGLLLEKTAQPSLNIENLHESEQRTLGDTPNAPLGKSVATKLKVDDIVIGADVHEALITEAYIEGNTENSVLPKECPDHRINSKKHPNVVEGQDLVCRQRKASSVSCMFAAGLFKFDKSLLECKNSTQFEFCKFDDENEIHCIFPKFCSHIQVDGVNSKTGDHVTLALFQNSKTAMQGLYDLINKIFRSAFKFVFIGCRSHSTSLHSQQLVFAMPKPPFPISRTHDRININIVLLDSLSRSHFYRSLPLVISEFNRINQDPNSAGEVLDFSLFQALHGHSAENAHGLFTGTLFPENMTDHERERSSIGIGALYGKFRKAGYSTMYQCDLCWHSFWGIRMDLGFPKSWGAILERMKAAHIDDTGLTMANCRVLGSLGLTNPFTRTKGDQLCFNGDFHHNYLLERALTWHTNSHRPTISYTALNVPHDSLGLRTQTLNNGLVRHVRKSLLTGNTITILLADHGNTYTPFPRQLLEGRFEIYHPSLFMVIPGAAADLLGEDTMNFLRTNQMRLLTVLDLNAGLRALADFTSGNKIADQRGVFGFIPASRTCDDLTLRLPNLCVCDGWDNVAPNDTHQISVLEYAVGFLNNKIERQRQDALKLKSQAEGNGKTERRCHHLVPLHFENVRERKWGEYLITTMDFVVSAALTAPQEQDVFHVEVKSNIQPGVSESYLEFLSFDRLSPYEPYRKCADAGVDSRLCICSTSNTHTAKNGVDYVASKSIKTMINYMPILKGLPSKNMLYSRESERCIYLLSRNYHEYSRKGVMNKNKITSAVLEAVNICANEPYVVHMKINPYLMKVSRENVFSVVLHGDTLTFLCALVTEDWSWDSRYRFEYSVSSL